MIWCGAEVPRTDDDGDPRSRWRWELTSGVKILESNGLYGQKSEKSYTTFKESTILHWYTRYMNLLKDSIQ